MCHFIQPLHLQDSETEHPENFKIAFNLFRLLGLVGLEFTGIDEISWNLAISDTEKAVIGPSAEKSRRSLFFSSFSFYKPHPFFPALGPITAFSVSLIARFQLIS